MPKTYYAVTRPILAATAKSVKSQHFNEMQEIKKNEKYTYDDLVNVVNADSNLKLYPSAQIANLNNPEREVVEDEKRGSIGWGHIAFAYVFPVISAAAYISNLIAGPNQIKNSYKSIILKITILDESCIVDPPEQEQQLEGSPCLGVLPKLQLRQHSKKEGEPSPHDWNIRFSTNSNYYIQSIVFNGYEYNKFWTRYPKKYNVMLKASEHSTTLKRVTNFITDYHSPRLGLFLRGHWNRTHLEEAKTLEAQIKRAAGPTEALDILWKKREELERSGTCNLNGSFFKRITFAIEFLVPAMQEARNRPPHRR